MSRRRKDDATWRDGAVDRAEQGQRAAIDTAPEFGDELLAHRDQRRSVANTGVAVVPLYAARVGDLKPGDFVVVQRAFGHDGLIHPAALPSLGLQPDERIHSRSANVS
jgi:hypothetical protein